jgi:D-alanyl-D-alanine dipeptidase
MLASAGCGRGSTAARTPSSTLAPPTSAIATSVAPAVAPTAAPSTSAAITTSAAPSRPTTSASATRTAAPIPPVSAGARAAGLIDVRTIIPAAIVDLRYATSDNFVGVRLYPHDARCLVHESMAPGLQVAARRLRQEGDVLVFWDCYRPHAVQVHMFRIVPNPNWVARPGPYARSHEAGRSVDVSLARSTIGGRCVQARRVEQHCLVAMGTGFDSFSPRAYAFATDGVSARAQANRARLRAAMLAGGITVYAGEWWHFDGPDASVERPILHAPLH